jgi:hypothetical protein
LSLSEERYVKNVINIAKGKKPYQTNTSEYIQRQEPCGTYIRTYPEDTTGTSDHFPKKITLGT